MRFGPGDGSMKDDVIRVEGLSKRYRIPNARHRGDSVWSRMPWHRSRAHDLWALNDVSFSVAPGEVVGIIGRNGAGKSTLLKILSGVTHPTSGRALLRGRVASLLEVGTGFHPDLTGRQNVFLNGALLGMSRAEIRRKFDEILAFAEVEEFLDTPIKRFSTGMQMRLAFAVAAHLDGEILIIDEALSVGDAAFQAKCVDATTAARGRGRTVLLVSHNMAVLHGLAGRILFLENGRLQEDGPLDEVLSRYLTASRDAAQVDVRQWNNRDGSGEARVQSLAILGPHEEPTNHTFVGGSLHVRFHVKFSQMVRNPQFGARIHSSEGHELVDLQARHDGLTVGDAEGMHVVDVRVPCLCLYPGRYPLSLWVCDSGMSRTLDHVRLCATLVVQPGAPNGRGTIIDSKRGVFYVPSDWQARKSTAAVPPSEVCA